MTKKVTFAAKRPSQDNTADIDNWVQNREAHNRPPEIKEPMKRLTIDVSVTLHNRIKSHCAMRDEAMADVIRDLLEQYFAPGQGAGQGARS